MTNYNVFKFGMKSNFVPKKKEVKDDWFANGVGRVQAKAMASGHSNFPEGFKEVELN